MTDTKTLAYINLFAVLGTLEKLCETDDRAKELLKDIKPVAVGFEVKGGPAAVLAFSSEGCVMTPGVGKCDVRLPFSSCEKFNGLISGTVTPIPSKGFTKIGFLTGTFTKLTGRLTELMRPSPEQLKDRDFFVKNTVLTFYTVAAAIAQIGNNDDTGRVSASNMLDGDISFGIKDVCYATIRVENHRLTALKTKAEKPRALMCFGSLELANALFAGRANALAAIGSGEIEMGGMISMLDNMNRILNRVSLYLA